MNKPASELIALADAIHAWQQNPATTYTPTNILQDHGDTVVELARLAANQSGRRPGVDALREVLKPFAKMAGAMYVSGHCGGASPEDWPDRWHVTVQGGKHFHTPQQHGGYLTVADFRRAAEALATPPAQPAPSKCEDCSGSGLALNSAGEPDICKTCGGNTVAPHGKPDGALREALSALVNAVSNMRVPQNVADAALQITIIGPVLERAKAALHSAAETSPGDVLAMKEDLLRDEWFRLVEKDDRTSPEEYPEMCLITREEVGEIIDAAIDRLDVKAEAKSPDAGQLSVREFREDAFRSMEVQICGDTRTVQFGVEDHGGDHPTMPCCAISWTDAADLASWIQSCITRPTAKPEAPAASVDAIRGMIWKHVTTDLYGCLAGTKEAATAIAALISGGR